MESAAALKRVRLLAEATRAGSGAAAVPLDRTGWVGYISADFRRRRSRVVGHSTFYISWGGGSYEESLYNRSL